MSRTTNNEQRTTSFLFEIGTEEVPAADLDQALEQLYAAFIELKQKQSIPFSEDKMEIMGTPRRLAVLIKDFPQKQSNIVSKKIKGPPAAVAFKDGKPTQPAIGFAKAQSIKVENIKIEPTDKGDYLFAVTTKSGKPTETVLAEELAGVIQSIQFNKAMRWQAGSGLNRPDPIRFIRPIRWLVAMLGSKVVAFGYADVRSANITYGHRLLAPQQFKIKNASDYKKVMSDAKVVAEPEKRARTIERALKSTSEGTVDMEDARIQKTFCEVVNLIENPQIITGFFDKKFLKLPRPVVETVLQSHQRYFPMLEWGQSPLLDVGDSSAQEQGGQSPKKLTNFFVIIHNGNPKFKNLIKRGHEKVVKARLEDAQFYIEEDGHKKLSERVKDLTGIIFHEGIGNLLQKTKRLEFLVKKIGKELNLSQKEIGIAQRAAYLAKADLLTSMVSEFDELQGVIGAEYAKGEGEDPEVAKAIFEQYLPRHSKDIQPKTIAGILLSIAERIDTLCAYASIGIMPTSTGDPYALRRISTGLVDVLFFSGFKLSSVWLAKEAYKRLAKDFYNLEHEGKVVEQIVELINQRIEFRLSKSGIDYDIIRGVASLEIEQPVEFKLRTFALQSVRNNETTTFQDLVTIYNRAFSITDASLGTKVEPKLLQEPAERALYNELKVAEERLDQAILEEDYIKAIKVLAALRKSVDTFFDKVLVITKEAPLKRNRYALLNRFIAACLRVADLSKIVKSLMMEVK